jgi:hypothetical protein
MDSMNLVPYAIFWGTTVGEASEEGRLVDTMREYTHAGRVYLHEGIVHEAARLLGYTRPEQVAEVREENVAMAKRIRELEAEVEKWTSLREAFEVAAKDESTRRRQETRRKKTEPEEVFDEVA